MKKYILILLAFATTNLFAQSSASDNYLSVSYLGYSNGLYKLQIDSKQPDCNVDVIINWDDSTNITNVSPKANGSIHYNKVIGSSTVFSFTGTYNPHAKFYITALTVCDWRGSNPSQITIDISYFIVTPILLDYFKGIKTADGLTFTWKTSMEQNVAEFELQHQVNGEGPWITIQTIKSKGPSTYQTDVKGTLKTATLMGILALALFAGLLIQYKRYLSATTVMFLCILAACTKTSVKIPNVSYNVAGTYRLVTKDIDSKLSYSQVINF